MSFLTTLAREAWAAHAPWLILGLLVTLVLLRRFPRATRPRLRISGYLIACHLLLLVVAAAQRATGYDPTWALVLALAFALLAGIGLSVLVLFQILLPPLGVHVPRIVIDVLTAIAVGIALIAIGKRAGFSVAGLITTSAVLTAVIGFSMQETLGNVMGGLALQLDNSIKVGDWLSLGAGQPSGKVTEIRWRYTAIETRNWETIIVPNSILMKNPMMVLGRRSLGDAPTLWRRIVEFHVDFRTPPTEVIAAVQSALRADPPPTVATDPPPFVIFHGIRDSYGVYGAIYFLTNVAADFVGDSDVRTRVYYALARAGIPPSIPAQTVFLTEETPERASQKQAAELERRLAALGRVDLFRAVPAEVLRRLAAEMVRVPFGRGEVVTREGEIGDDCLYLIKRGEASVRVGDAAGREVAQLGPGAFFGEMSLMTGEKRSASVVAITDLVCYRLDKPAFEAVLREHPEIADEAAEVLSWRREKLELAKDEHAEERRRRLETEKEDLVSRIRSFFGLFE